MPTDDQRADFDDEFGSPRRPSAAIAWTSIAWITFGVFNVGVFAISGLLLCLIPSWKIDFQDEDAIQDLINLSILVGIFIGSGVLTIGFLGIGFSLMIERPLTLKPSLVASWAGTSFLVVMLSGHWIKNWHDGSSTNRGMWELGVVYVIYVFPALLGSIVATVYRHDYQSWRAIPVFKAVHPVNPISPESNSPA